MSLPGPKCPYQPRFPTPRLASPPPKSKSSDSSSRLRFRVAIPAVGLPGAEGLEEIATLVRAPPVRLAVMVDCCSILWVLGRFRISWTVYRNRSGIVSTMYVCFFSLFAQEELLPGLLATFCDLWCVSTIASRIQKKKKKKSSDCGAHNCPCIPRQLYMVATMILPYTALTSNSWKTKCNFLCRIVTIARETSFATLTPKSHAPGQFSHRLMSWKPNSLKSHISEKSSSNIEEGLKVSTSVLTKLLADGVNLLHLRFSTIPWEATWFWNKLPLDALRFAFRSPAVFLFIYIFPPWSTAGWSYWLLLCYLFTFFLYHYSTSQNDSNVLIYGLYTHGRCAIMICSSVATMVRVTDPHCHGGYYSPLFESCLDFHLQLGKDFCINIRTLASRPSWIFQNRLHQLCFFLWHG